MKITKIDYCNNMNRDLIIQYQFENNDEYMFDIFCNIAKENGTYHQDYTDDDYYILEEIADIPTLKTLIATNEVHKYSESKSNYKFIVLLYKDEKGIFYYYDNLYNQFLKNA